MNLSSSLLRATLQTTQGVWKFAKQYPIKPKKNKHTTMRNIFQKEVYKNGEVKIRVKLPPIPITKSKNDTKSGKGCVKI